MIYKILKPSGKDDVEKRENLTSKKRSKGLNNEKKPRAKLSGESPASLDAFNYLGKNIDDPQVKLKLLEFTHKTPAEEASAGVLEFVKRMTSLIGGKKCPIVNENSQKNERSSANDKDGFKDSFEKVARNDGTRKNSTERAITQKVDFSSKPWELKSKNYVGESSERKRSGKIVNRSPEKKIDDKIISRSLERRTDSKTVTKSLEKRIDYKTVNGSAEKRKNNESGIQTAGGKKKESPQGRCPESPKKGIPLSPSDAASINKRILRRSEIPLLKSRKTLEKKTEVVSLLMLKPLKESESSTSINFCQDLEHPPKEEVGDASSKLEIILKAGHSSPKLVDIGEVDFKSSPRQARTAVQSTNAPTASKVSLTAAADKKIVKANKPKTLDLERVKTSSFTVLRTESDGFSRLESFHKQNITAKETARAEIAIKASKIMVMTSKTSFGSIKSKKNFPTSAGNKGNKLNSKKTKKIKNESEERNAGKVKLKMSSTPHLDICKEIIATGKVGCLTSKKINEKDNEKLEFGDKSSSFGAVECGDKTVGKTIPKAQYKSKEYLKKNKIEKTQRNPEEVIENNFFPVNREFVATPSESFLGRFSGAVTTESESEIGYGCQENISEKIPEEEVKLMARELAGLVIKGTALTFEDMQVFDKPPEVDKIKLEIKIDVPSEEDITDSEALECDSSGEISRGSLDWLLKSKLQNNEKQALEIPNEKNKTTKDDFASWDWFADDLKTGEWQTNETVLQGPRQSASSIKRKNNVKTTIKNGPEKKTPTVPGDRKCSFEDSFDCSMFFQNDNKPDAKVRSGFTRSYNQEEKMFEDPTPLKLRRRNSEPYSLRGFIWKRVDVTSSKNLKNSVSSVASSLKHLNTDEMDDFIFWEAVPQKMTSCWEMSLYHFKRPWSVLSCSVFKDNRRSSTPGLILDTLRSGGMSSTRRPLIYQNDRINRHKGNIFDVEPSISQKNIDIRNWLAALNFTTPIPNTIDVISEGNFSALPVMDAQKQANFKRRNVVPHLKLPDKELDKKIFRKEKHRKLDKWNINDMDGLKELIRRKSGSYVTKEQFILSELSSPKSTVITSACTYSIPPNSVLRETGDRNTMRMAKLVKSVETSYHLELPEGADIAQEELEFKEASVSPSAPLVGSFKEVADLPPEFNIWKYLFLFTLMFIILQHSLRSEAVNYS